MRKRPRVAMRNSIAVAQARIVAALSAFTAVGIEQERKKSRAAEFTKGLEDARKRNQGRQYRGQVPDHATPANERFSGIYSLVCYQRRRGR